jgi:uncharacterized protein (DUF2267 family)
MSANGLEVFDTTVNHTNIWLHELTTDLGCDRKTAWHVLGSVLRALRDRLPTVEAAHLGAQLPLLVRGAYYDHYRPELQPVRARKAEEFLALVADGLRGQRPIDLSDATTAVFDLLDHRLPSGTCHKVRMALPEGIRRLWTEEAGVSGFRRAPSQGVEARARP